MHAQEIQHEMQQVRDHLGTDVRNLARQAREATDWRHYVRRYPWICLGVAAATGYLIVPQRKLAQPAILQDFRRSARNAVPASSVAEVTSGIMATVIRAAASALVQRGMAALSRRRVTTSEAAQRRADRRTDITDRRDTAGSSTPSNRGVEPW